MWPVVRKNPRWPRWWTCWKKTGPWNTPRSSRPVPVIRQRFSTSVRIPVSGGHSESINVEFENDFNIADVRSELHNSDGVTVQDNLDTNTYPMPIYANGKDDVFVGRIRRDESQPKTLNMWVVSDNLRKGAATNTIQIAEYLLANNII